MEVIIKTLQFLERKYSELFASVMADRARIQALESRLGRQGQ